jgi:hypothetical protein
MIAKKNFSMDVLIDLMMTKLFILAEYVCDKTSCACGHKLLPQIVEPALSNEFMATIRFSNEDQTVNKRVNRNAYKKPRLKNKFVEGELFKGAEEVP